MEDNEPAQERHYHWKFIAFDGPNPEPIGDVPWALEVSVIGFLSEADALLAVKDLVTRQHYKLRQVFECPTCGWQGKTLKVMRDMADAVKGSG